MRIKLEGIIIDGDEYEYDFAVGFLRRCLNKDITEAAYLVFAETQAPNTTERKVSGAAAKC